MTNFDETLPKCSPHHSHQVSLEFTNSTTCAEPPFYTGPPLGTQALIDLDFCHHWHNIAHFASSFIVRVVMCL